MALLRFYADSFCRVSCTIGQCLAYLGTEPRPSKEEIAKELTESLVELERELGAMELRTTRRQLEHITEYLLSKTASPIPIQEWRRNFIELLSRMRDELEAELFLSVPLSRADFYEQKVPLFGTAVATKFPKLTEDISEAGKCLALNRYTACVFHLMRVMEAGLQEFGNNLGVQLVEQKNWQNILDEANRVIKGMDPKRDPLVKSYAEAAAHLYNVKIAWRNEVMHPKETYTEEEAENIFRNVKTFIFDLAQLI